MPFTPAHAAAVLPLVRRSWAIPSALVIGSMGPDLTFYLPVSAARGHSHSLGWAFTVTPAFALAGWALWRWLLAAPARDLAPTSVRARWRPARPARGLAHVARLWLAAYVSVVIGTLTHLFWDGFTHHNDWAAERIAALHIEIGGVHLHGWLQWASSIAGLALLGLYAAWRLAHTTPRPECAARAHRPMPGWQLATVGALVVIPTVSAAWHLLAGSYLFVLLTESISLMLAAALLSAIAWHLVRQPVRQVSMSASADERTDSGARLARTDADASAARASSSKP